MEISKRIAFTGAPGAGKTALADKLRGLGYVVVPESARHYISNRKAMGCSPRPSPIEFAHALLEMDIGQYESVSSIESYTFFDRTTLDSLCMLELQGALSSEKLSELLMRCRYNPTVFLFPPWKDIYCNDSERDQSYDEAVKVCDLLENWYLRCGYSIETVPPATVDERCIYVLDKLGMPI